MHRCEECRFEYATEDQASIPERLRTLSRRYGAPLTRFLPGEDGLALLRSHPVTGAWSGLEYACHVRDVLEVQLGRVERALAEDRPTFEPMRREERVLELAYDEQDPVEVVAAVAANGDALATAFEALDGDQWDRPVVYSFPKPWERSLLWVGQHTVHELHHHLLDVGRTLRAARGR
ncbi:MAG TPA: DinB family protein [Acidimicrobiales bacterium]|nr:DinB family protein [Acidimicrobiales bacterium]